MDCVCDALGGSLKEYVIQPLPFPIH